MESLTEMILHELKSTNGLLWKIMPPENNPFDKLLTNISIMFLFLCICRLVIHVSIGTGKPPQKLYLFTKLER